MENVFIPPKIQKMVNHLTEDTGIAPTVRRYVTGLMLEHSNEHVDLTIHYKLRGGKWAHAASTLTIKGVRQKILAKSYEDYVEIFRNGRRKSVEDMEVFEHPEIEWDLEDEDVDKKVLRQTDELLSLARKANPRACLYAVYGRRGEETITKVENEHMVIYGFYSVCQNHGGHMEFRDQRVVDKASGKDITPIIEGSGKALAEILARGIDNGDPGRPDSLGAPQISSRSNSVEIRRATVIRN